MAATSKMLVTAGVILMIVSTQPTVKGAFKYDHKQNGGSGESSTTGNRLLPLPQQHDQHKLQRHPHRHHHHSTPQHQIHRPRNINGSLPSSSSTQRYYHQNGRDVNKYLQWFDDRRIDRALLHFKKTSTTTTTIRPRFRHRNTHPTVSSSQMFSTKGHLSAGSGGLPKLIDNGIQLRRRSSQRSREQRNHRDTDNNGGSTVDEDDDYYYYYDDDDDDDNDDDDDDVDVGEEDDEKIEKEMKSIDYEEEYSRVARGNGNDGKRSKLQWHQQRRQKYAQDYNYHDYPDDEPSNSNDNLKAGTSLTDYKFQHLGTAEAVQESVRRHRPQQGIRDLAEAHKNMMLVEGQCSQPIPKVVAVPINDTSKIIVPHCTILHRCGNDSGCCFPHTSECVAKKTEDVFLHFYLIPVFNNTNRTSRQPRTIVVRHFINHTECHCVEKSSSASGIYPYTGATSPASSIVVVDNRNSGGGDDGDFGGGGGGGGGSDIDSNGTGASAMINEICRCPNHFDVMQEERGVSYTETLAATRRRRARPRRNLECRCECLSNNQACLWLKDGHEGFTMEDRRCIKERICTAPICRYGDYDRETGRCPKPKNHKRTILRYDHG